MSKHILVWIAGVLLALAASSWAAAQSANDGYNVNVSPSDMTVLDLALQPDGKLLVVGLFTGIAGQPRFGFARLLANGAIDPDFAAFPIDRITTVALQPSGHIVIGGDFTQVGACACPGIARLNPDGSLDTAMTLPNGANRPVGVLTAQPDGRVLVAGAFTEIGGVARNGLARLNTDGSLDPLFNPVGVDSPGSVVTMAAQSDGKVLLGGNFTQFAGVPRNRLLRLNANGSLDTGFYPPGGADGDVYSLTSQADGKVLVGGDFTSLGGAARNRIGRLNADGSLDAGFYPPGGADRSVRSFALQPDGKIFVGGHFSSLGGVVTDAVARLDADGSPDAGFLPQHNPFATVESLAVQADGKVLVGGMVNDFPGLTRGALGRLNADGSVDANFDPPGGANGIVRSLAVQADAKVLVGGAFTQLGAVARNRVARLKLDASVDPGFDPPGGADNLVASLAVQPDGKWVLGGSFHQVGGVERNGVARLNRDGSLDGDFHPPGGANGTVNAVALQPDGAVLLGGAFTSVNGLSRKGLARLNADGSLDSVFYPPGGADDAVNGLAVQADGKVLVGGAFTRIGDIARKRIARLNADGTLDAAFYPPGGADGVIHGVAVQPDGKVLVGGGFKSIGGVALKHLARLNADGSLDNDFQLPGGADDSVFSLALQADGKILIGGAFTSIGGVARKHLARLHADGTLDNGFDLPGGVDFPVRSLTLQADGRLLLGGDFSSVGGVARNRIARLSTSEAALQALTLEGGVVVWRRAGPATELALPPELAFSDSGDPDTFAALGVMQRGADGWRLTGFAPPTGRNFSLRAQGRTMGGGSSGLIESTRRFYIEERIFGDGFEL